MIPRRKPRSRGSAGERVLCIIIGRAGSKGLPGKNAKLLAGRPMICHTIDDALEAESIDRTVISTDGDAIADAARSMGVEIVRRPPHLASDSATVDAAVRHAIETIDDLAPIVVILYANVPIRPPGVIDRAVDMLVETGADSVQSYCDVGKHHPHWMMRMDAEGRVTPFIESRAYRRQDLPPLLIPDGGVIAVRRPSLFTIEPEQPHAFLGVDRRGIVTGPGEVVDIDSEADLRLAETFLQYHGAAHAQPIDVACASVNR